ncbi:NADP-dependent oxidoreductase [Hydrogenophaga sp.]|uniref:NADP-dependent oxidoreductase n=1 Tax=Hydrogenophaga sp. TaxID=1904254 RepID=UPI0026124451|nr:NADP-dependent oxidoreductase [Hydrogenophaga sp.]MCW5652135.1 NADP-dependent oxidoreductase [Hydrogenophaga sp.]
MTTPRNRQVLLARRPAGVPQADDFELTSTPAVEPGPGQVRVRNAYLSVEPAMRGWVSAVANYSQPVPIGGVMRSFAAGWIDRSNVPDLPVGTRVTGSFGWQDYAVVEPAAIEQVVADEGLPLQAYLGVLGINGVTAHYGLLELGRPRAGDTVVVSTAAGAVGSCAGQIARLHGCRTVGIAGGEHKTRLCKDTFGFDVAIDYKAPDFNEQLAQACAGGVNVYFDNTAGPISDAVMGHLAIGARVVVCGTAALSSWSPWPQGPRVERHLLVKRASMAGFVIFDHPQHQPVARRDLVQWIRAGDLVYLEDVLDGLEQAPDAIAGLYRGENLGKRLIRIAELP